MTRLVLISAVLGSLYACDNEPGEGKPKAAVAEPASEKASAPSADKAVKAEAEPAKPAAGASEKAEGSPYTFSQEGSTIAFVGAKVTGKHDGAFERFVGKIELPGEDPTQGSVAVEIETASLKADQEKLTKHLKSKDFFHVEEIPKASFKSAVIKAGGADGASHTVTGNLDLHGVTKEVTFPATITVADGKVTVKAEFVINRKDFGIVYPGMPDDLIKDDVLIKLEVAAARGSQS